MLLILLWYGQHCRSQFPATTCYTSFQHLLGSQSSWFISHCLPSKPSTQWQTYEPTLLRHVPPFLHGLLWVHSLMSCSQRLPKGKSGHCQFYYQKTNAKKKNNNKHPSSLLYQQIRTQESLTPYHQKDLLQQQMTATVKNSTGWTY